MVAEMNPARASQVKMEYAQFLKAEFDVRTIQSYAGLFGRDVSKPTDAESQQRAVRLVEPLLDALGVPHYAIDSDADVGVIRTAFDQSREMHGPTVVFVGAPTT